MSKTIEILVLLVSMKVITAIESGLAGFQAVQIVRCNRLLSPWVIDTANCKLATMQGVDLRKPSNTSAEIPWTAECGSKDDPRVMTGVWHRWVYANVNPNNLVYAGLGCCSLKLRDMN